jgi:hypothetical protein
MRGTSTRLEDFEIGDHLSGGDLASGPARLGKLRRICENSDQAEMFGLLSIAECCGSAGEPN